MPTPATPPLKPAFVSDLVTKATRFYLNLDPAHKSPLRVVCGGREACASDYAVRRTTFPFHCVEFVAGGEGHVVLAGKKHPLRAGSVFTYAPGVPHEIYSSPTRCLDKYYVDFAGTTARALLRQCGLAPGHFLEISAVGDVREEFDALLRRGQLNDPHTERTCTLQLELLLRTIARCAAAPRTSAVTQRSHATFERCRRHIDEHFLRLHSLADLARDCHVEKSHVCRLFRQFHHESPLQYLQRRRMQWAADRLHSTPALVREVADELSLDAFHFSRSFKRVHGISPVAFRATRG